MDRRVFLGVLASLVSGAGVGETQSTDHLSRVGHLAIAGTTSTPQPPSANWDAFIAGLRETGYIEGRNFVFEHRDAGNRPELFPAAAADLVRARVSVIFARGPQAVRAARQATKTIPIVAIDLETDPVAAHFVKSLSQPGGNVTGMFLDLAELSGKHIQLFKELLSRLSQVAVLGDPEVNRSQMQATAAAGRQLDIRVDVIEIRQAKEIDDAFRAA